MARARPGMNFLNTDEKVLGSILLNDSKASIRSNALRGNCIRANATEYIWCVAPAAPRPPRRAAAARLPVPTQSLGFDAPRPRAAAAGGTRARYARRW